MAFSIGTPTGEPLTGTVLSDVMFGDYGNDTINAGAGRDSIDGGFGNDRILSGAGAKVIDGGAGTDTLVLAAGPWAVKLPTTFNNLAILTNETTGQRVAARDIETLILGAQTITFNLGSDGSDTISGTAGTDYIKGRDGDDAINAGAGNDFISTGIGSDTLIAGAGNDFIDDTFAAGGAGKFNTFVGTNRYDLGDGNDVVMFNANYDFSLRTIYEKSIVAGGKGVDIAIIDSLGFGPDVRFDGLKLMVRKSNGVDQLRASFSGVEQIYDTQGDRAFTLHGTQYVEGRVARTAGGATVNLAGTIYSEVFTGDARNNAMTGNGGADRFYGKGGNDTAIVNGRPEFLSIDARTIDGVLGVRLRNSDDVRTQTTFIAGDVEHIRFQAGPGAADDILFNFHAQSAAPVAGTFTAGNDFAVFDGGLTASTILVAAAGADFIIGTGDVKQIDAGLGDDRLNWAVTSLASTIAGGAGADRLSLNFNAFGQNGVMVIDGGDGDDDISVSGVPTSSASIIGGLGDDSISFGLRATVNGGAGNDGFDIRSLGLTGNVAASTVDGGDGTDVASIAASITEMEITKAAAGALLIAKVSTGASALLRNVEGLSFSDIALPTAQLSAGRLESGNVQNNTLVGTAALDFLRGVGGNDKLSGGPANDILVGGDGNDTSSGGVGNDILTGDLGNDVLSGDAGNDILYSGKGIDLLTGGDGNDHFRVVYLTENFGNLIITDFSEGPGDGDVMAFARGNVSFDSAEEILAKATQVGANTVITLPDLEHLATVNKILLVGVIKANLAADDFYFYS